MILLSLLILLLSILYLYEREKCKAINKEIHYIKERIGAESYTREDGYILVPSERLQVKELAAEMNSLLDIFYFLKADYRRSKQAMVQVIINISHDL